MKKSILLAFGFLLITSCLKAQERGKVEVVKDARIDTLIAKRQSLRANNPTLAAALFSGNGYRVQIFNGLSRADAYNAQAKVQAKYPGMRTYISYNEPNFKVKAGDFRTRIEAEKFKQELQAVFAGLFIISEKINTPKAETGND